MRNIAKEGCGLAQRRAREHRQRRASGGTYLRASTGQTLVIFALSLTVLIALLGLAVDTVRVYDLYARMERAAEAAALAGVVYMANDYARAYSPPGDGNSAISRALQEAVKNGFGQLAPSPNYSDCPSPPDPTQPTVCSACPNPPTSVEVAVCPVEGKPTDLSVTITESIDVILLGAVGVGPIRVSATAQAEYLPSIQLGSRANYFGDQVECSNGNSQNTNTYACAPDANANHLQYFFATVTGAADLKESGDPYVYCAEGPAQITQANPNNYFWSYNGYWTDHPQWSGINGSQSRLSPISQYCGVPVPGGKTGNPDQQVAGFDGPATQGSAHPGGYNYQIAVSAGVTGSLWIYNANYVPQSIYGSLPLDRFVDYPSPNFYQGPTGEGIGNRFDGTHYDAPLFYFNTTVSLYQVNNLYDRTTDTLLSSVVYPPYDDMSADLQFHGCGNGQVYNPYWNGASTPNSYYNAGQVSAGQGCVSAPACMLQWCQYTVPSGLTSGTYRLVVEVTGLNANTSTYNSGPTDGYGSHSFALKVCDSNTLTSPIGCTASNGNGAGQYNSPDVSIYGWNNMDVIFDNGLSQRTPNQNYPQTSCVSSNGTPYTCVDLGCIPSQYAGRTVTLGLFDPGDGSGSGSIYIGVVAPPGSGGIVTYPSFATTATIDGVKMVDTADGQDRHFNGDWLNVTLTLPSSYNATCGGNNSTGWWQMAYAATQNGQPTDKVGISFSLVGSPVHLVQVG